MLQIGVYSGISMYFTVLIYDSRSKPQIFFWCLCKVYASDIALWALKGWHTLRSIGFEVEGNLIQKMLIDPRRLHWASTLEMGSPIVRVDLDQGSPFIRRSNLFFSSGVNQPVITQKNWRGCWSGEAGKPISMLTWTAKQDSECHCTCNPGSPISSLSNIFCVTQSLHEQINLAYVRNAKFWRLENSLKI